MIPLIIALIVTGAACAVFAIIAIITILRNSRLERKKDAALQDAEGAVRELEAAIAGKEALKAENGRLQQELHYVIKERNELQARSTALQEALEAKPTQPKRVVPKRGTAGGEQ